MTAETHAVCDSSVLDGKYAASGMASFSDLYSPEQVRMLHAYLIREQGRLHWEEPSQRR